AVFQVTNVLPENDKWIVSLTAVDDVEYLSHNQFFKRLRTILKRICGMGSEMTSLQFDLALEYAFQANDIIKVITDSNTTLTFIIELIGDIYMNKKQFDLALEYYVKAIKYVDANELFLIAQYHFDIGRIYFLQNNLEFSLKHCLQSLEILDEMFPLISIDHLHQFLSKIYFQISNYPMAIKHAEKALAIDKEMYSVQDKRNTDTYILLGDIYFSTKQYDLSIEYLTKGVEFLIYKKSKYYNQISTSYITIASCYFRKKIYDKACRYFIKALITKELHLDDVDNMEEMNFIIGQLNFCIAECYSEMNKCDLAISYYKESLKFDEKYSFSKENKLLETIGMYENNLWKRDISLLSLEATTTDQKVVSTSAQFILDTLHLDLRIGLLYMKMCCFKLAVEYLTKAVSLLSNEKIHENMKLNDKIYIFQL
ncbi:unnamed protein product, partial [Didymodactylos carnosus]